MIKRTKKIIGLLPLTTLVLCSCGNSSANVDNPSTESISFESSTATAESNSSAVPLKICGSKDDEAFFNKICEDFQNEYSDTTFEFTYEPVEESEAKDTLLLDVASMPDVFSFTDDQLSAFVASGILSPVTNADEIIAANNPESVEAASIDETLYAYPETADNGYFMYYNKKYFSDSDLESLDKMLSVAAKNNKKVTMDWSSGWYFYSFFGNTGLELGLNDDGLSNYCTWNASKGDITGKDVVDSLISIAGNKGFKNTNDAGLIAGAKKDDVIAGISGVWSAVSLKEAWGDNLGAVKLPTYTCNGKQIQMASYAGYKLIGINHYSKNIEWAEKFATWVTNEQNQLLRFQMRGLGPSNINAAASSEVKSSVAMNALQSQSEFSHLQRIGANYWNPVQEFALSIANGKFDQTKTQEALNELVSDITASNSSH